MPRKEPKLVKFLLKGLDENIQNIKKGKDPKYVNLIYENLPKKDVFSIKLPHKTSRLDMKYELIFKNWYAETRRKYIFHKDYSDAKQAMTSSLRKSDYVKLDIDEKKLTCRILSEEEVAEKKRLKIALKKLKAEQKKELKKLKDEQKNNESEALNESGYESGFNSPENFMDSEQNDTDLLQVVQLDHPYGLIPPERNGFHCDVQNDSNEAMVANEITETSGTSIPSDHDKSEMKANVMDACPMEDFPSIPVCSKDVTLEDLDKIPGEQIIGDYFQDLQLAPQVPDLTIAEAKKRVKLYVCQTYEVMDEVVVLMCELFQEMDVDIADTSGSIRIIYDESIQPIIEEYSNVKDLQPIDDHYLLVFFERPIINHR